MPDDVMRPVGDYKYTQFLSYGLQKLAVWFEYVTTYLFAN